MDIDSLAPLSKEAKTLNNENYCCSIAQIWEKANVKGIPKVFLSFVINKNLILCYAMKSFHIINNLIKCNISFEFN